MAIAFDLRSSVAVMMRVVSPPSCTCGGSKAIARSCGGTVSELGSRGSFDGDRLRSEVVRGRDDEGRVAAVLHLRRIEGDRQKLRRDGIRVGIARIVRWRSPSI